MWKQLQGLKIEFYRHQFDGEGSWTVFFQYWGPQIWTAANVPASNNMFASRSYHSEAVAVYQRYSIFPQCRIDEIAIWKYTGKLHYMIYPVPHKSVVKSWSPCDSGSYPKRVCAKWTKELRPIWNCSKRWTRIYAMRNGELTIIWHGSQFRFWMGSRGWACSFCGNFFSFSNRNSRFSGAGISSWLDPATISV